jgi:hypothetical protein
MAIPCAVLFLTSPITLALGRSKRFLVVGLVSVLVHTVIVVSVSSLGTRAVAVGQIASSVFMTCLLLAATFGRGWPALVLRALGRSLPAVAFASVFVLLRLPLSDPDIGEALAFGTLSALVYAALVVMLWPQVGAGFLELLRRPARPTGGVSGVGDPPR